MSAGVKPRPAVGRAPSECINVRRRQAVHLEGARISAADAGIILDAIVAVAEPIRISYLWRPVLPDPGDDLVLETAVNGRAEMIVTFNRRHFEPAASRFGVEILVPADAIRRLEKRS